MIGKMEIFHKFWKERFELWMWKGKHMSKHTWEMKGDE